MAIDIFGDYTQTTEEIAKELIDQNKSDMISVSPKIGTRQGYHLVNEGNQITGIFKTGFYAFFLGAECVYVGSSMSEKQGITNRISRFVKGIQGNYDKNKEWHSGAEKYRFTYGSNFSDLKLIIMKYPKVHKRQAEEIEKELIRKLKPKFNRK